MAVELPQELLNGHVVGAKLRVTTGRDEKHEGVVFTYDPVSKFLVLEEHDTEVPTKSKTYIFQMENLRQIELLEKPSGEENLQLPNITEDDLLRMEQRNKAVAERALASIGRGVSTEAQAIFDALNKTMPCEWDGKSIRVMGEVTINAPYQPENSQSSNAQVLSRVQKVLEGVLSKLRRMKK